MRISALTCSGVISTWNDSRSMDRLHVGRTSWPEAPALTGAFGGGCCESDGLECFAALAEASPWPSGDGGATSAGALVPASFQRLASPDGRGSRLPNEYRIRLDAESEHLPARQSSAPSSHAAAARPLHPSSPAARSARRTPARRTARTSPVRPARASACRSRTCSPGPMDRGATRDRTSCRSAKSRSGRPRTRWFLLDRLISASTDRATRSTV